MDKKQRKTILVATVIFGVVAGALFLVEFQTVSKEEAYRIVLDQYLNNPESPLLSSQYKFLKFTEFRNEKPIFIECEAISKINYVTENCQDSNASFRIKDGNDRFVWIIEISAMFPEKFYVDTKEKIVIGKILHPYM